MRRPRNPPLFPYPTLFRSPKLADVPDILAELAGVQMHAIQTSGNCVRNVTADHLAGIARDEIDDPRPYCEIIRRSEEHTSELQSQSNLVCRLLLEKKNKTD